MLPFMSDRPKEPSVASKPDDLTLFSDLQSLIWYATDLAKSSPESLLGPVDVATIAEGGQWRYAVTGDLPPPSRRLEGRVSQAKGTVSDSAVTVEAKGKGKGSKKKERLDATGVRRYGAFLQAIPLVPAETQGQTVALLPAEDVGELLDAVSVSGKGLSNVAVAEADEGRALVQLESPPWYLIERGALGEDAKFLRKVPRKRVYVEWGFRHPFEVLLEEPADPSAILVVAGSKHEVIKHGPWEGAGPGGKRWHEVEVSAEEGERSRDSDRIQDDLRLVPARQGPDPVVWLVDGSGAEDRVVRALMRLPEDDLRHVDLADLDAPEGRIFIVRELGSDRRGTRAIPRGRGAFVHVPGSRGVYVPMGARLSPDMPAYVYERTFEMRPGEIALVEQDGDDLVVSKVPESAFRPVLSALSFDAPGALTAAPPGRTSPWATEPWEEDAPTVPPRPPKPPKPDAEDGDDDADAERTGEGRSSDESLARIAAKFAAGKADVDKEQRKALDDVFKALPASLQASILTAVKAALEGRARKNASSRDEARVRRLVVKALLDAGIINLEGGGEGDGDEGAGKGKAKKGKKKGKKDKGKDKPDAFAELERRLLDDPEDAAGWLQLAEGYLAAGEHEEAVRAAEMAAWEGDRVTAKRAWEVMAEADVTGAYAAVAKFAADAPTFPPMRFAEAANAAADAAGSLSDRRKRARWLLNSALAAVADDELHAGRERDAILAELASRGVGSSELPSLVRRRLLERYSAAEATGEAAEAAEALLDEMVEIAAATVTPIGAAEILGEAAMNLAAMGENAKAAEVAREAIRRMSTAGPPSSSRRRRPRAEEEGTDEGRPGGPVMPDDDEGGWAISALAKAAAALLMAQEHAEGLDAMTTAIRWIRQAPTKFATWEAVQHALEAMAKAGLRPGDAPVDEFIGILAGMLDEGEDRAARIKQVGRLIEDLGDELHVSLETVESLGIAEDVVRVARRLLLEPDLDRMEYEAIAVAVDMLGGHLEPEESEALLKVAAETTEPFDSYTGKFLLAPALAATDDPVERATELAGEGEIAGRGYKVLSVILAGAKAATSSGKKPWKARKALGSIIVTALEELEASDPDAYESPSTGGGSRKNLCYWLDDFLEAVPGAFADDRKGGADVVRQVFDRAPKALAAGKSREGEMLAAGVIAACAEAMASLGFQAEAGEMAAPLLDMIDGAQSGFGLNEFAESAARAAQAADDKKLAMRLAAAVKKAAEPLMVKRKGAGRDIAGAISALTEAVKTSAKAGDEAGAETMAKIAAEAMPQLQEEASASTSLEAADKLAEAAATLSGASRYEVAREIASTLKVIAGKTIGMISPLDGARTAVTSARRFLVEGSAFKEALAKWKGEDERRIRDRIISDCRPE